MSILISGSLAYDYIMDFPDSFKNHILPDQIHILNVSFEVSEMHKNYGGVAGNIAYTIKLLGGEPLILAPLGRDGGDYLDYFKKLGLNTEYIKLSEKKMTSSCHITTDKEDNQIAAYYSGAADETADSHVYEVKEDVELAILGPTKKEAMIQFAKECYDRNIVFVFDPSHQLPVFNAQELMLLIGQAKFFIGNDYEMKLTQEKIGWNMAELLKHVEVVITTLGEQGSVISTKDGNIEIGICSALSVDDPTGAGDAYRAGFFSAYVRGLDLKTCGQVGAVAATYAVENYGTQNHRFTLEEFKERYKRAFIENLSL